jgi:hydroxyacylglutathione hydrolase
MVLDGQPEPPRYFAEMKRINREGARVLGAIATPPHQPPSALPPLVRDRAWIVDMRAADAFAHGHVPTTLSIPYNRSFSTWAGWLLPYDVDVWLLTDASGADTPAVVQEAVRDLALIGLDRMAGWFDASALTTWQASGAEWRTVPQLTAGELAERRLQAPLQVIDVRGATEWEAGHLPQTRNIPVGLLADAVATLDPERPIVTQCQSGARSAIAASVLLRAGRLDVVNLVGGYVGWRDAGLPVDHEPQHAP